MIVAALTLNPGGFMYLVWMTLAISTGVVVAKAVKLYTNL